MPLDAATAKKLRLQPGQRVAVLNAPADYWNADAVSDLRVTTRATGERDFVHVFARTKAELDRLMPRALRIVATDGLLWVSYPKRTSPLSADLSRDAGWDVLTDAGWRPVTQIAIDETWAALRFRPRAVVRSRARS